MKPIVVAGHACVDLIPQLPPNLTMSPGTLTHVGPMAMAAGGAVPNVGVALHRLGRLVRLAACVGDDALGRSLAEIVDAAAPGAANGLIVRPGEATSYSVVVSVPGRDRAFWHCPGVNDTFEPDAVPDATLAGAAWLHFGYPPIMRRVCDDPAALARLFARARGLGLRTSLDLCGIDPNGPAGGVDWRAWLAVVLPHVDVFTPSFDETAFALGHAAIAPTRTAATELAAVSRALGAASVLLKLGDRGLFFSDGRRERHVPCFAVDVVSATGAGDCTIAGFVAGLTHGMEVDDALTLAVAAGGASCERADATSGVPAIDVLRQRIRDGWPSLRISLD